MKMNYPQTNIIIAGDSAEAITQKIGPVLDYMSTTLNRGEEPGVTLRAAAFFREETQIPQAIPTVNRALCTVLGMLDDYGLELLDVGEWRPKAYLVDGASTCCLEYEVSVCRKSGVASMDDATEWHSRMNDMLKSADKPN